MVLDYSMADYSPDSMLQALDYLSAGFLYTDWKDACYYRIHTGQEPDLLV